jgi:hypothetical protein
VPSIAPGAAVEVSWSGTADKVRAAKATLTVSAAGTQLGSRVFSFTVR